VADGTVWITDGVRDRLVPLDPEDNEVLAGVRVGRGPSGVASGAGAVWVANTLDGSLSRVDPRTRRVVATIDVGGAPRGVAVGAGSVWVTEHEF
jgi:YVTN family beta-propeller protein